MNIRFNTNIHSGIYIYDILEDNFNLHKNIIDKIKTINYTNSYANWYSYEASQKLINKISNLFPQKQIKEEKI